MKKKLIIGVFLCFLIIQLGTGAEIDSCATLSEPGVYYLTQDIIATRTPCIEITQSNITLDCQDNFINGNLTYNTGIKAEIFENIENITIKNCIVKNFLMYGGYFTLVLNSTFNNLIIENIYDGVFFDGVGLYLENISNNKFENIRINRTYFDGVYLKDSKYNHFDGFGVYNTSGEGYGFFIQDSSYNIFKSLKIHNNIFGGLIFRNEDMGSNYNQLFDSYITNNGHAGSGGINIYESEENIFYNNYLNNTLNVYINNLEYQNFWNTTIFSGVNIIGGDYIAGNFWATTNGNDFSETCNDFNLDGICDNSYNLTTNNEKNIDFLPITFQKVKVNRHFPNQVFYNKEFEVVLEIIINENLISFEIFEEIPLNGIINYCSFDNCTVNNTQIKIFLNETSSQTRNITYNLTLVDEGFLNGTWLANGISKGIILESFINLIHLCGDGFCGGTEDCLTCPEDCGDCPSLPSTPQPGGGGGGGGGGGTTTTTTSPDTPKTEIPKKIAEEEEKEKLCKNQEILQRIKQIEEKTRDTKNTPVKTITVIFVVIILTVLIIVFYKILKRIFTVSNQSAY